jgi:protoheme IX farnesyltransferase
MSTPVDPTLEAEKPESRREIASASFADFVALAKPRITTMVVITTAGGLWLAHRARLTQTGSSSVNLPLVLCTLLGTALVVAGANALNMYIERDFDRKMERTKNRPLPTGRMHPRAALWFGVIASSLSVPVLAVGVNALTALLAVLANLSYVLAYTPLKQRSHHALLVGAVPGAIPPLLGWTAVTGRIDAAGLVLFALMFTWQVPHSLAIALFRKGEYARAGLVVMPNVTGDAAVKHSIARWLVPVVASSLLLIPLGLVRSTVYLVSASVLGAVFFAFGVAGLREGTGRKWARGLFGISLLYLVGVFAALVVCA